MVELAAAQSGWTRPAAVTARSTCSAELFAYRPNGTPAALSSTGIHSADGGSK